MGNGSTHILPSGGKSVWIANNELVTFKVMAKDGGGEFALVEVVGLPGSGPPPHIHHSVTEVYSLLEGVGSPRWRAHLYGKQGVGLPHPQGDAARLEERDNGTGQDIAAHRSGGV